MKLNKYLIASLLAMCIIGFSMSSVSASKINIDADWRLIHQFKIIDVSTGETIWDKDVAAGDAHSKEIGQDHKNNQIIIELSYAGEPKPNYHIITINMYNNNDITLYGRLKYNSNGYYKSYLKYDYGNFKGETNGNLLI